MIEFTGFLGGAMLALCAVPEVFLSIKRGHSKGLSWPFIGLWFGGEVLLLIYVIVKHNVDLPLTFNYLFNIILLSIIIKYKLMPRRRNEDIKT